MDREKTEALERKRQELVTALDNLESRAAVIRSEIKILNTVVTDETRTPEWLSQWLEKEVM